MAAPEQPAQQPEIKHIFATTVFEDGGLESTVFALLADGSIVYTGIAKEPQWHYLPPIPSREEAMEDEEGVDDERSTQG